MKKKILSAAVLAALGAGGAQAVNLGQNGTGQVLLFPYYTVQGNEETLLSVVNTTSEGKIVKIRFREAYNSREVLDFNIYLSPYDVWTGKVVDSGDGAGIVTNDNTCTVPKLGKGVVIPFRSYNYDGSKADLGFPQDGAPTGIERTREGYVEIIEMGRPIEDWEWGPDNLPVWDRNENNKLDYEHSDGVPDNCDGIEANWSDVWAADADTGVTGPNGGLFGSLAIINVQSGTEVAVAATALENVYEDFDSQHANPGDLSPSLTDAEAVSNVMLAYDPYNAEVLTSDWFFEGIDAVSAVLMATNVINEYSVNPAVEAESAWIVTFPTKWAYVDYVDDNVYPPFGQSFFKDDDSEGNPVGRGKSCDKVSAVAYD
ncbi:MAG TPA: hypothetical protein EYP90_00600, partial [Chromatiaceae bacterium]|nr:hypothetical protein [Chromatiaceae bacterium]